MSSTISRMAPPDRCCGSFHVLLQPIGKVAHAIKAFAGDQGLNTHLLAGIQQTDFALGGVAAQCL